MRLGVESSPQLTRQKDLILEEIGVSKMVKQVVDYQGNKYAPAFPISRPPRKMGDYYLSAAT